MAFFAHKNGAKIRSKVMIFTAQFAQSSDICGDLMFMAKFTL